MPLLIDLVLAIGSVVLIRLLLGGLYVDLVNGTIGTAWWPVTALLAFLPYVAGIGVFVVLRRRRRPVRANERSTG